MTDSNVIDPSRRRRFRRVAAVIGVILIAAVLVVVTSFHSATLGLTVANDERYSVQFTLFVDGAVVFNQTLGAGQSWSANHALAWFAPVDPWSCETVVVTGHTNAGLHPINDTFPICSGQPISLNFSAGANG